MPRVNIPYPSDDEFTVIIKEILQENQFEFPETFEFSPEEVVRMIFDAMMTFFDEFPDEGYFPLPTFAETGEEIQNPSSVHLVVDDTGFPYLNVGVYQDDGAWLFNGYVNFDKFMGYFAGTALQILTSARRSAERLTDEEFKDALRIHTINILGVAMRRLPKWIEILVESFETKISFIWAKQLYDEVREENGLRGVEFPKLDLNIFRQRFLRKTVSKMREFMNDDYGFEKHLLGLKEKNLALVYRVTYQHWESMQSLQIKGMNWRRYVCAGDMTDVTDDLIEDFESDVAIGDIALEHAARRVRLFNTVRLTRKAIELREKGVMCSGYSRSKLFEFKKKGEELLDAAQSLAKTAGMD